MESADRLLSLDVLYFHSRRKGFFVDDESRMGYKLCFDLCSAVLYEASPRSIGLHLNAVTPDFKIDESDLLFDFVRPVYLGTSDGLERVVLERFNVSDAGIVHAVPDKLLRFKDSKDLRRLTENDHATYDWLIQYCVGSCKTRRTF